MKALWGAATIKVVGAGIDDASFAEDLSRLIGDSDVDVVTVSTGDGKRSRSRSVQQRRILPAAELRALPKGRVLILSTGAKAALAHAAPWYTGPRRAEITAAINRANTALAERARHSSGAGCVGGPEFPTEEIVLRGRRPRLTERGCHDRAPTPALAQHPPPRADVAGVSR
jgi:type IV secretory pathway TraG/TraD family ATPase VirD4